MVKLPPPLDQIRPRLEAAFGSRLQGVILYGSRARGDHRPDSDLDLMVLLDGPVRRVVDAPRIIEALYPVQLEVDFVIAASPHELADYRAQSFALYRNAKREGIEL